MEHWEALRPGGYRFVYDDALFRPGTDTFLLSSLPRLKAGLRVCDLGCGTGLLGLLLMQRQAGLTVIGVDLQPTAVSLAVSCSGLSTGSSGAVSAAGAADFASAMELFAA